MSDQPQLPEGVEFVQFEWSSPEDPKDTRVHVLAEYNAVRIHLDFDDDGREGTRDLGRIVGAMPNILGHIRRELLIRNESSHVDDELLELLGEDEV